jgi:hypothetical protein
MSLATFKKKSINKFSSATKKSGKPTNEYWIYQGPYGRRGNLSSFIFTESLQGFSEKGYYTGTNAGFSVTGSHRNIGSVGANMKFSKSGTPYRGIYPKGWGGTFGRYPDGPNEVLLNITPVQTGVAIQNAIVKPPVLSNKGMLQRRFKWINSGQYPNNWVQPVYTGNQTDTSSQGLYIHNKSAANDCHYDVNDPGNYVDYFKRCGSTGCQRTPARGYKMSVQQANAPYTKTLHQPKDASAYTLRVQRRCQDPVGFQKPFPYAVQTGTGVLRGGINVSNVANACNTSSNINVVPPDWYTGAAILKSDGTKPTMKDQLELKYKKELAIDMQARVYDEVFLKGTTN